MADLAVKSLVLLLVFLAGCAFAGEGSNPSGDNDSDDDDDDSSNEDDDSDEDDDSSPTDDDSQTDDDADPPYQAPNGLEIVFFDVGQGDSLLVRFPDGATMLVDGGPNEAGYDVILPYFNDLYLHELDYVVVTHPDADHCGGLDDVLKSIPVGEVWENGETKDTVSWQEFAEAVAAQDIEPRIVERGDGEDIGDCRVEVLQADEGYSDVNANSIVLMIDCEGGRALLTGDITEAPQDELMDLFGNDLQAELVKVPHHGSPDHAPGFAGVVEPQFAIVTVGSNNYGHPDEEVMAEWDAVGATLFRTDEDGTVIGRIHDGECTAFGVGD